MELKVFQKKVLDNLNEYLKSLSKHKLKHLEYLEKDPDIAKDIDFFLIF